MTKSEGRWSAAVRQHRTLTCMLAALVVVSLTFAAPYLFADKNKKPATQASKALKGLPVTDLNEDEAVSHALNRLGFGPRPGDMERVKQMGLEKWIDQQLNANSLDDSAVQARLQRFS